MPEAATEPESQAQSTDNWNAFELVTTRNIFSNTRRPGGIVAPPPPPPPPPAEPETYFILRGITDEDGALTAYFEDTRGGGLWVHQGQDVCRGKIVSLSLDRAVYERSDVNDVSPTTVALSHDLEGTSKTVAYSPRPARTTAQSRQQRSTQQSITDIQSMMESMGMGMGMGGMGDMFGGGFGGMNSGRGGRGGRGGGRTGGMDMGGASTQTAAPIPQLSAAEQQRVAEEMAARRQQQMSGN